MVPVAAAYGRQKMITMYEIKFLHTAAVYNFQNMAWKKLPKKA